MRKRSSWHSGLAVLMIFFSSHTLIAQSHGKNLVTDIEGNQYRTITIGKQVWMQENLRTTRYSNGDQIPTSDPDTLDLRTNPDPKYQWFPMRDSANVRAYGRLYTWHAATDSRNICPRGWHLPSDSEFCILENYVEPEIDPACNGLGHRGKRAGLMLKESGLVHWVAPDAGADNRSRFTALPAGIRYASGEFTFLGSYAYFWAADPYDSTKAWSRRLYHDQPDVARWYYFKNDSFSIRCVKD